MQTNIMDWIRKATNGDTKNAVAVKSDLPTSTLNRQWNEEKFSADVVISVAHAYGASPIEGLRALGVITHDDIERLRSDDALKDATDDQLLQELARRLAELHGAIVDNEASAWNVPINVVPAALHDKRKEQSKGVDEEFA